PQKRWPLLPRNSCFRQRRFAARCRSETCRGAPSLIALHFVSGRERLQRQLQDELDEYEECGVPDVLLRPPKTRKLGSSGASGNQRPSRSKVRNAQGGDDQATPKMCY